MVDPDVIYVVRRGERNEALQFSLRSLGNLPHNRVFIAGYCPSWVKNVTAVPVTRKVNKFFSIEENLRAAVHHPEIGNTAVYFNDDFYVMEPIPFVPVMHDGWAADYKKSGELMWRMRDTIKKLPFGDALSYELHVPLPIDIADAGVILRTMPYGVAWRTWYGNVRMITGTQVADVKSRDGTIYPGPFMSSSPNALRLIRSYLEDTLPQRSPYV